jgi:truncated hemoglobin YjbI
VTDAQDLNDIRDRDDIARLVTAFYERAFSDPVLGPIFNDIAQMDLPAHMPIMCDFWETVLFQAGKYGRNAFDVHLDLHRQVALSPMHFQRWLDIWERRPWTTCSMDQRRSRRRSRREESLARSAAASTALMTARCLRSFLDGPDPGLG